ncbi:MAG: hypothetical protein Q8K02_12490 [Flavobacterium sp.]|nr:hypothetical protein [Flavobacterium sp.]
MKTLVSIVLFLFVSFISMPTIIGYMNKDADLALVFSMSEEEETHNTFKIKDVIKNNKEVFTLQLEQKSTKKIFSENNIQHDEVLDEIFSPPPEI